MKKRYLNILKSSKKSQTVVIITSLLVVLICVSLFQILMISKIFANKQDPLSIDQINKYLIKIKSLCENNAQWRYCYGKELSEINKSIKFPQTLQVLSALNKIDPKTADCHLIAHGVSASEIEKAPEDWINIFNYVDHNTCTNGFVHGVLEGRSRFDSTLELNENTIPQICSQIELKTSQRPSIPGESADDACGHSMGHILLANQNGVIDKAVQICTKLPQDIKLSCLAGVFMENITRDNLEIHEVAKKFALTQSVARELEQMCENYQGVEGFSCWRELAHIYTSLTDNKPVPTYELCYQTQNEENAKECYMHAINLMVLSENYSLKDLKDTCSPYYKTGKTIEFCISRTITPLLGSSIEFIDRAVSFCETQSTKYHQFCYSKIGQMLRPRSSLEKRKNICKKVPDQYFKYCTVEN
jgi:hypothetical protein